MTICELATLDARSPKFSEERSSVTPPRSFEAVLKPMYANFLRNGHSHREARSFGFVTGLPVSALLVRPYKAGFLFMDWLGSIAKAKGQLLLSRVSFVSELPEMRHPSPRASKGRIQKTLQHAPAFGADRFDPAFHQMLIGSLLVCDHTKRKTLAQCLSDLYLESDKDKAGGPSLNAQRTKTTRKTKRRFKVAAAPWQRRQQQQLL